MEHRLLQVQDLKKYYSMRTGIFQHAAEIRAVDGVSFAIHDGETLGLIGESGCGKTTVAKVILRLEEPTDGQVLFRGNDIFSFRGNDLKGYRRNVQMIFQDPQASLDPRMTLGESIGEALLIHGMDDERERGVEVEHLLAEVGLKTSHASRYPHEFSGGQKQRIGIARALALRPDLVIADEPVSALDISIQAQILNLLTEIKDEHGLSYLFIAHNMNVIRYMCDRVVVMKAGKIVEEGEVDEIFAHPGHPYTRSLFAAVPVRDPRARRL